MYEELYSKLGKKEREKEINRFVESRKIKLGNIKCIIREDNKV